ncbi:MAG TPA: hypothetical protein VHE30_22870 [Polyangiaceae bacterium]|nr:hypothetical protein [Polyangiaceae bacterium]
MASTTARFSAAVLSAGLFFHCALALAADPAPADAPAGGAGDKTGDAPATDKPAEGEAKPEGEKSAGPEAPASEATAADIADAAAGNSAAELPGTTYRFIGFRYRGIIVPKFMQNLFAEGGRTVYVHAFGPEFAIRKDGFEYNLSAWLGLYNLDDTGFKGKSDPEPAWEIISAKMQILYLTSDFLWSHEFTPEIALNYGLGAGFGFVFGNLNRTQSYPLFPGQDPNDYAKCPGPRDGDPGVLGTYCTSDNTHYPGYKEPSWAGGGSKPIIFPWLALQTGLRFKPSRNFAARLDLGFGTSGFFFGLGGDYGL